MNRQKVFDVCKKNDIAFLGVFGSAARDELREGSDIDLLVRYVHPKGLFDHSKVALELESIFGKRVDLVTERSLSRYIRASVYRDLKPLYGRYKP